MKASKMKAPSIPQLGIFVAVSLLSLTSLSCVNNPVDPLDPKVKPSVVSTYPQAGGIGPFDVFAELYSGQPHFSIHFNKVMDKNSFTRKSITCSGFSEGVYVQPVYSAQSSQHPNIVSFGIFDSKSQYNQRVLYEVGKTYTITIDTLVCDFNANHLAAPYSFSFTPEPFFRVRYTYPQTGDTLGFGLDIYFNSPIDSNILGYLSLTPAALGEWHFTGLGNDRNVLSYSTSGLHASESYTLRLDAGAKDRKGNVLSQALMLQFYTKPFKMEGSEFYMYNLNSPVYVWFSAPVDTESVKNGFMIMPATPGHFKWHTYGNGFDFVPDSDWIPSSSYTFTITTQVKDADGNMMPRSVSQMVTSPSFHYSWFSHGEYPEYHDTTALYVYFSGRIDLGTVRSGFEIKPALAGQFRLAEDGSVFSFRPYVGFKPSRTYEVFLDTTIHSLAGYPLAKPDTFSFTAGRFLPDTRHGFKPIPIK
jgi:hypothetical protein